MPRYYFHIRDGDKIAHDPEGADFVDLASAEAEAVKSARELLSQRVFDGELVDGQAFELTDENGSIAAVVKFKDVLRLT
ncbi:hypothetical protein D3C87_1320790 [compost metagenome]|jgi:hypothetical protein|uniref:DUF6894 family protein n=1 Tax=Rhizobium/Agrobacterium group TaxID=227290 RepID=UPI000F960249|nr:hypothetical protein [Agrobacterium sp. Ap1]MBO0143315.1 hypothetical protein [Agrobacterium sp. Ap1]